MGDIKRLYNAIPVKNYKSLGTVFETTSGLYVYDTGTGKVFSCNEVTYNLFKIIFSGGDTNEIYEKYSAQEINKSISEIIEMIQKENILQASYSEFDRETDFELEAIYNYSLQSLILEVTQKCNFRCKYCIYHSFNEYYRNYGLQDMNWETAKKAIDYVSRHSGEKELSIAFYGGEPLINYDVMKKTIEYSEMVMPKKTLIFAFTTNLSLMTLEKAKFFAKHNCYIMCSLDGPKIIHDAYRVDIKGDGTFNKVIEGLKNLLIAFGDRAKTHIKFNVVICPPYSRKKLDAIKEFFDKLDYLPAGIDIKYSYVESGSLRKEDIDYTYFPEGEDIIGDVPPIDIWLTEELPKQSSDQNVIFTLARDALARVHKRFLLDHPCEKMKRNGCCIPGGRRIYVDIKGNIALCERVGKSPSLGNINKGIDLEQVKRYYLEEYEKASVEQCKNCWAVNLCNMCYAACYRENGIDIEAKNELCTYQKDQLKGELIMYHQVLETNPELLEHIQDIEII